MHVFTPYEFLNRQSANSRKINRPSLEISKNRKSFNLVSHSSAMEIVFDKSASSDVIVSGSYLPREAHGLHWEGAIRWAVMSSAMWAADTGARALSSATAGPSGSRATHKSRGPVRPSAKLRRGISKLDTSRATPSVSLSVATGDTSTVLVESTEESVDESEAVDDEKEKNTQGSSSKVYVDADRVAGPSLADSEYGEHAAAFLSGNFQPLTEELTTVVECGGDLDDDDDLSDLAPNGSFSEVFEGFVGNDSSLSDSPEQMRVVGSIPHGFPDGKFSYVGPNPKFDREHYKKWGDGPDQLDVGFGEGWHHWFEGDGMVYAVDFDEGDGDEKNKSSSSSSTPQSSKRRSITYRNRYVRTNSWHDELREDQRLFAPLMNASGKSFLPHAVSNFLRGGYFLKDSANTALANYGGKMLALQDTMPPWELDSDSLETKGACDFDGQLPFYVPFTAHPKKAPDTGNLHFFGFNPVYPPHISMGSLDSDLNMSETKPLWHNALQGATFMHDFCVTAKRVVLFEGSMNIRPTRMLGGNHPLKYDPTQNARFGLATRDKETGDATGEVTWIDCGSHQMVYHFINAWEDSDTGFVKVVGVREDGFFHGALAANGTREWIQSAFESGEAVPRVHEWVIDPVEKKIVSQKWLFDDIVEVPRINDAFAGVKNKFAYAGRVHESSLADDAQLKFDAVVKFDLSTGTTDVYEHGIGRYGMEQQFVSREGATDEDDGWLVLYVHDEAACAVACDENACDSDSSDGLGLQATPRDLCDTAATGRSECVILNAKNLKSGPVCRIALPSRVPYGAHALWTPKADEVKTTKSAKDVESPAAVAAKRVMETPPEPRMFAIAEGTLGALAGTAVTGMLRGASGLFVNGWRPWLGSDDKDEYAFVRGLGARFTESRKLGKQREEQASLESSSGKVFGDTMDGDENSAFSVPPSLRLYEREGCGGSKRVRETLTMLDLACEMRPCPLGATKHRKELKLLSDEDNPRLPYLEDVSTGVCLTGADDIVQYLYEQYLDGEQPSPLVRAGFLSSERAQIAADARGAADGSGPNPTGTLRKGPSGAYYTRPSVTPEKPLQFWAYEASPFCSLVRETLSELEIPYTLQPCARGSPRRTSLFNRTGTFQVPYLEDPNTGVQMFESAEIIAYLRASYQATPPVEEE